MRTELSLQELLAALDEDRELLELLLSEGLLQSPLERPYSTEEAELARVARVLIRELEVNFAGVEVILHLRRQVVELRRQLVDVMEEMHGARLR